MTTARDPEGRPTVFDNLPEDLPRVVAIGRLDINTEGLLLLTNDGGLARVHRPSGYRLAAALQGARPWRGQPGRARQPRTASPSTAWNTGPIEARLDRVQGDNAWISLGLREGKNREVKRILEHLGLQVNRLIRLSFGPFQLGEIEEGLVEEVKTKVLRDQLGDALAQEAGVDFESPVREPIAPFGTPTRKTSEPSRPSRDRDERPSRAARPTTRSARAARDGRRAAVSWRRRARAARPRRGGAAQAPLAPRTEDKRLARRRDRRGSDEQEEPRRGADPRAARAAAAERPRERAAAIESAEGRKVGSSAS